ncbi:MAG: hypothetical protein ABR510_07640 [Trueperaceae bacterium]
MTGLSMLALAAATVYAAVNAFGAWSVVRRRSRVAAAFLLAAAILTVGAVALGFGSPSAAVLVPVGALLASLASWWNARIVLRRMVPRRHAVRAVAGACVAALAIWASVV